MLWIHRISRKTETSYYMRLRKTLSLTRSKLTSFEKQAGPRRTDGRSADHREDQSRLADTLFGADSSTGEVMTYDAVRGILLNVACGGIGSEPLALVDDLLSETRVLLRMSLFAVSIMFLETHAPVMSLSVNAVPSLNQNFNYHKITQRVLKSSLNYSRWRN
jgi:hypothetical protein